MLATWGTMDEPIPKYLYKILSYRNWQSTLGTNVVALSGNDDEFIHFSTEGQVDKIIEKYWAGASQYAVLKIDAQKLQGILKYEANPGGTNKYYHLYDGFIPIDAILEAKIVFREPLVCIHQHKLDVVQVGDPVLRQKARPLTKEEILSPEIQGLIGDMIDAMRRAPGVGVAAPQVGKAIQLAVVEDMDQSHLSSQQIEERDRRKVPLQVIINPTLFVEDSETASFFEGCLSVPSILGVVPRAKAVRVECLNERAEPVVIRAKGWHARILQHEIDHLNGTLFIDKAVKETFMTGENHSKLWKDKPIQEICNSLTEKIGFKRT